MVNSESASSNVDTVGQLRHLLADAEEEVDAASWEYYVPISNQRSIITPRRVNRYIHSIQALSTEHTIIRYTDLICRTALSLFAILLRMRKEREIFKLLDDGLSDTDLPLERIVGAQRRIYLARKGKIVNSMQGWTQSELKDFGKQQFIMTAPTFNKDDPNDQHFTLGTIIPYVSDESDHMPVESDRGGYSEVLKRRLHSAHHNFWDKTGESLQRFVAIKRLNSGDADEFKKEVSILRKLGSKSHPHLIQLFGTFTLGNTAHLIFPWANANLRQFWEGQPVPSFNRDTVFWSLEQVKGIAQALSLIHDFTTHPTLPLAAKLDRMNCELGVVENEKNFGRHGDIKPENFLWFKDNKGFGTLKISDFGLGRFHGRDSRSKIRPTQAQATPTYEPPECALRISVSRKYDTWSLGCVLMEYLTWLLLGDDATLDFAEARSKINSLNIDDDKFYEIVQYPSGIKAIVAPGVERWAQKLRRDKSCSKAIHDLLTLIMDQMLVIDQDDRITSRQLYLELKGIVEVSSHDDDYLLAHMPMIASSNGRPRDLSTSRSSNTWPINNPGS